MVRDKFGYSVTSGADLKAFHWTRGTVDSEINTACFLDFEELLCSSSPIGEAQLVV